MVDRNKFERTADSLGYEPEETAAAWEQVSKGAKEVGIGDLHTAAGQPGAHQLLIEDVANELDG